MVTFMIIFGSISATTTIVTQANDCSCWCLPVFGNVVPYAFPKDKVGVCIPNKLLLKTDFVQTTGIARLQEPPIVHRVKKQVLKAIPPPPTFKTFFCLV